MRESTQILVVGGGPAGSTAAGLLAKQGFQVTLLERDQLGCRASGAAAGELSPQSTTPYAEEAAVLFR